MTRPTIPPTRPIHVAARATSTTPTWFTPLEIDGVLYTDGGAGHNNSALAREETKSLA